MGCRKLQINDEFTFIDSDQTAGKGFSFLAAPAPETTGNNTSSDALRQGFSFVDPEAGNSSEKKHINAPAYTEQKTRYKPVFHGAVSGFRYYDPELGRFIQRDPSGYPDGPNNYLYCHNNPINFVDPEGLVENSVAGYFKEMGNVFLGYKDAAVSTVTGVATVVAHPINTAKGIGNAVVHPVDTVKAIANDYGNKLQTARGQGSIVGEILIDVATGGTVKAISKSGKIGRSEEHTSELQSH